MCQVCFIVITDLGKSFKIYEEIDDTAQEFSETEIATNVDQIQTEDHLKTAATVWFPLTDSL